MGVFSEMDAAQRELDETVPFAPETDANAAPAPAAPFDASSSASFEVSDDEDTTDEETDESGGEDAEDGETTADAKPSATKPQEKTAEQKKAEHEAAEAKRKAEWEAKQAEKKAAVEKALQDLLAMSDDDVAGASVKRTGDDLERLTRRNMKICVTEDIQTKCLDNSVFARMVCHPKKSMINCFKYINKKAEDYVKAELEIHGQKAQGGFVEDVPDDLCYLWAEEYFRDADAEVDKDKDDKFVEKTFYGGTSTAKTKKKEPSPKKEPPKPEPKPTTDSSQLNLFGGAAV